MFILTSFVRMSLDVYCANIILFVTRADVALMRVNDKKSFSLALCVDFFGGPERQWSFHFSAVCCFLDGPR